MKHEHAAGANPGQSAAEPGAKIRLSVYCYYCHVVLLLLLLFTTVTIVRNVIITIDTIIMTKNKGVCAINNKYIKKNQREKARTRRRRASSGFCQSALPLPHAIYIYIYIYIYICSNCVAPQEMYIQCADNNSYNMYIYVCMYVCICMLAFYRMWEVLVLFFWSWSWSWFLFFPSSRQKRDNE